MFIEPVVHACVHELQIWGRVFLAQVEFPEVLLLSLGSDGENMGDIFADDSGSWRAWKLAACHFGDNHLGQLHLRSSSCLSRGSFLPYFFVY